MHACRLIWRTDSLGELQVKPVWCLLMEWTSLFGNLYKSFLTSHHGALTSSKRQVFDMKSGSVFRREIASGFMALTGLEWMLIRWYSKILCSTILNLESNAKGMAIIRKMCPTFSLQEQPETRKMFPMKNVSNRVRGRHEKFNGLLKNFDLLKNIFKYGIEKHAYAVRACAVITQIRLERSDIKVFQVFNYSY